MRKIRTPEQVIEALGGAQAVCDLAEANSKQVWHWHARARQFPANTYVCITRALARRGYVAPVSLWPMKGLKRAA